MSLREALHELAASARARRPTDVQRVIDAALEGLRGSGIVQSCLQPGEMAPDFALPSTGGGNFGLEAMLRNGPVVVAFYRGGWCPYCNLTLRALNDLAPALQAFGASLVAIAPERTEAQRETGDKHGLRFPLLTDRDNRVAQLFGLAFRMPDDLVALYRGLGIDLPTANATREWVLPLPATYVIARDGTVAAAFIDIDYTKRAEPAEILAAVAHLAKEPVP